MASLVCDFVCAGPVQTEIVSAILREAAARLRLAGMPMWRDEELRPDVVRPDVEAGRYVLASVHGEPGGVARLTTDDPRFWPESEPGAALYIHRLAVRRRFAGTGLSAAILEWCVNHARLEALPRVRLDCDAKRPMLRRFYETFGFRHHSDVTIGPYAVARYELRLS